MRLPKKARSIASRTVLFAAVALVGACSGEVTSPAASFVEGKSMSVPGAASYNLAGVPDGTYMITFDPSLDQTFLLGRHKLIMPANSVCNMATSGYGPTMWNASCAPHTLPINLTVVIKGTGTDNPHLDFYPAMRFNPTKTVDLFVYVPKVNPSDLRKWVLNYCPDLGACYDEARTDASLVTGMDRTANMLFRRVKHFSGYAALEFKESGSGEGTGEVAP